MSRVVQRQLTFLVVTVTALYVTHPAVAFIQEAAGKPTVAAESLLGAWRLERFEAERADGAVFLPFGTSVSGMLVYLPGGRMVVAYGRQDRPIPQQPNAPTPAELAKMVEGFDAYWGTFEVDAVRRQVIHHVTGAFEPRVSGTDRVRSFMLDGDTLILSAPRGPCWWEFEGHCASGEQIQLRLIWRRL